jgi:hypothetical protein
MLTDFTSFTSKYFVCQNCDFKCSKKGDWNRHILSSKHKNVDKMLTNVDADDIKPYKCECGKIYKHRQSLYVHKQTCVTKDEINKELHDKDLIDYLLKENSEFKEMLLEQNKMMMELAKTSQTNNSNNNIMNNSNNHSHNKTFNLNLFLNETCKDAMNIMDFINSLQLQVSDLENVGKVGYVKGLSNIIIKNLKALDVEKRPVHCTDTKREIIYVKDNNEWQKETNEKPKLRKALKLLAHKNIKMLPVYREKYPDCEEWNSKKCNEYNKIVSEAMGGEYNDDEISFGKIIKNVVKEISIDKTGNGDANQIC